MDGGFFTGHRNWAEQERKLGCVDRSALRHGCGGIDGSGCFIGLCVCRVEFNRQFGVDGFLSICLGAVIELDYLDWTRDRDPLRFGDTSKAERPQLIRVFPLFMGAGAIRSLPPTYLHPSPSDSYKFTWIYFQNWKDIDSGN